VTKPHLALVAPATVNGTVARQPPRRRRNDEVRAREYLTEAEVNRLIKVASENRHAHRDATAVLVAYRHGLRASELVGLRWDSVEFGHGRLHVNRAKSGSPSVHPLSGRELRALRRLFTTRRYGIHQGLRWSFRGWHKNGIKDAASSHLVAVRILRNT